MTSYAKKLLSYLCLLLFALVVVVAEVNVPTTNLWGKPSQSSPHTSSDDARHVAFQSSSLAELVMSTRGGSSLIPSGWHPLGYKISELGETFLKFEGCLASDVGRFLASIKSKRTTTAAIKDSWREIVRASKTAQSMRIWRQIDDLIEFCLAAGFID